MKRTNAFFRIVLSAAVFAVSAAPSPAAAPRRTVLLPGGVPLELAPVSGGALFGVYEVTQKQWEAVMGTNPSHFKGENLPVENVSFSECEDFVRRLNLLPGTDQAGLEFAIPKAAEWTAACLAGKPDRRIHLGYIDEAFLKTAWTEENSDLRTHPGGMKEPNANGLHDMFGNVGEWAGSDNYVPGYAGSQLVMGGNCGQSEQFITAAGDLPGMTERNKGIGLRVCARAVEREKQKRVEASAGGVASILSDLAPVPGRSFKMGRREVTQKQWVSVTGNNPSFFVGDDIPVNRVSFHDVRDFLSKLNADPQVRASGFSFRLPTADEWKEACLAGSRGRYGRLANGAEGSHGALGVCDQQGEISLRMTPAFVTASRELETAREAGASADKIYQIERKLDKLYRQAGLGPVAVGTKQPNAWGFYDMVGNVSEWTSTPKNSGYKVCGGSAFLPAEMCTASSFQAWPADERNDMIGFRLCADAAGARPAEPDPHSRFGGGKPEQAPPPVKREPAPVESATDPSLPLVPVSWPETWSPAPEAAPEAEVPEPPAEPVAPTRTAAVRPRAEDPRQDSDGDGLPDAWEKRHGLNPWDPSDALLDTDSDGLSNLEEYKLGSDPNNSGDRTAAPVARRTPVPDPVPQRIPVPDPVVQRAPVPDPVVQRAPVSDPVVQRAPVPVSDGRTVVRVEAAKTPASRSASGSIGTFFPVGGATIGKTTRAELLRMGAKPAGGKYANQCANYLDMAWWDHDKDGVCEYIFTTKWKKMPDEWIRLGMDWTMSFDGWTAFFRNRGFSIKTVKNPTTETYQGRPTFSAEFEATSPDGKLSFSLCFNYGNDKREGTATWSRNSLFSITVKTKR